MAQNSKVRAIPRSRPHEALLTRISGAFAPLSFLILLCVILTLFAPHFASRDNLKQIAVQAAVVAILACGQTAVIVSGNIDLSVGAVMAFSGVAGALAMSQYHVGIAGGVAVSLLCGLLWGIVTGLISAYGQIPTFIVTLGIMGVAHGSAGIISHSQNVGGLPNAFDIFGFGEMFGTASSDGIPYAFLMMVFAALCVHAALSRTVWGRSLYAMGGNREAARLSGIRLTRAITSVFALSGLLAGFASIVNVSRSSVASMDAGIGLELDAVAAAVVGGTSLFGGQGGIPGTIIGAFLIYTIRNGCQLKGLGTEYQRAIIGAVIILAVLYDRFGPGKRARAA